MLEDIFTAIAKIASFPVLIYTMILWWIAMEVMVNGACPPAWFAFGLRMEAGILLLYAVGVGLLIAANRGKRRRGYVRIRRDL